MRKIFNSTYPITYLEKHRDDTEKCHTFTKNIKAILRSIVVATDGTEAILRCTVVATEDTVVQQRNTEVATDGTKMILISTALLRVMR